MPTEPTPQTFANHRRNRPLYLVVYFLLFLNILWTAYRAIWTPSVDTVNAALAAIAIGLLSFYARAFALTVQDRVIRLEMRLRLRELLPAALHARLHEFTHRQLVAMRFASDAELPSLAERVLRDNIHDGRAIKEMIKTWEADHLRA
jgi:uncharacterized protein DUF6526